MTIGSYYAESYAGVIYATLGVSVWTFQCELCLGILMMEGYKLVTSTVTSIALSGTVSSCSLSISAVEFCECLDKSRPGVGEHDQ